MFLPSCRSLICLSILVSGWPQFSGAQTSQTEPGGTEWKYGIQASAGYFNFRDSLYVDTDPDPSGNLGDDWFEFAIKPWVTFERGTKYGAWFGAASWAYARTGKNASEISGGGASSYDFDKLYLGRRQGTRETGLFELAS